VNGGKGGSDKKRSRPLVRDQGRDNNFTRSASQADNTSSLILALFRITCPPLSLRPALLRKTMLGADHCLPNISGGDSQVLSESFVPEVTSEAPLTRNDASSGKGACLSHARRM